MLADLDETLEACTGLLTLNVNGCIGLYRLALATQTEMLRLEAAGCKQMRRIICGSAALEVCMAQSCQLLQVKSCAIPP